METIQVKRLQCMFDINFNTNDQTKDVLCAILDNKKRKKPERKIKTKSDELACGWKENEENESNDVGDEAFIIL